MEMTDHLVQVGLVIITVAMEIIASINITVKLLMCSSMPVTMILEQQI